MPNCDLSERALVDRRVNLKVPDPALDEMEKAASPRSRTNGGEHDKRTKKSNPNSMHIAVPSFSAPWLYAGDAAL